ncbi:unnamed protein product [Sphenostylis stenocarpa]|uniref:NPH3 domain-containing protein n=1 Tax=Sphenostylis stenocarpa TaxID=92480 RepID=A0AA86VFY2_9FABA|nr:unnamed protein product [Sphenostylis stenocarpa]
MSLLCSAAHFIQMECDEGTETPNLKPHIEKFLEGIRFWTWSELLEALKQCQDLFSFKGYLAILDRIVDHLIERLASPGVTSPNTCSSNRSSFQFSCDTSSNNSCRNNCSGATWWFEHLLFLKVDMLDKVIRTMLSYDFEHGVVSSFLFYYHNSTCLGAAQDEKIEATEVVINLLLLLDLRSISCKDLFNLNRMAVCLKMSTSCINKIEGLIGPLLDQTTIDYLLLPSPRRRGQAYDVDFVLRLVHIFFFGDSFALTSNRLKRVAKMMDLFLLEVAPDPHLKPCEFEALITMLPDTARESHDQLYLAMDMYLKVHAGLSEKEEISICCTLKHEKLSAELLRHLTRNLVFPSEAKPRAYITKQSRMKTLLQENDHLKNFFESVFRKSFKNMDVEKRSHDAEELRGDMEGMQSGTQLKSTTQNFDRVKFVSLPTANKWNILQDNYPIAWINSDDISNNQREKLKVLKRVLRNVSESSPEGLCMVDAMMRLNIDYHFQEEIDAFLQKQYVICNTNWGTYGNDLHYIALCFRLLRQQGYYVSAEVFDKFTDKEGKFIHKLGGNMKGLIDLYEASQLSIAGKDILDEAGQFSGLFLKEKLAFLDDH